MRLLKTIIMCLLFIFIQNIQAFSTNQKESKQLLNGTTQVKLLSSNIASSTIKLNVGGVKIITADADKNIKIVRSDQGVAILSKGSPDLFKISVSVIIPDNSKMELEIIAGDYVDYQNVDIAPSKGSISRSIDPSTIPYEYGEPYTNDAFYPNKLADLNSPYVFRDHRGQTVNFYPIQYNAVTKTLRVYKEITVKIKSIGRGELNVFDRMKDMPVEREFEQIYSRHFLNRVTTKYASTSDEGDMLIISHADFITAMQPFIAWKKLKGINTEIVNVATIGGASQIEAYVARYYNDPNHNLKYLLLVGDHQQVPATTVVDAEEPDEIDYSDHRYGCIPPTDAYAEVIVGRFSGTTVAHIETQVLRTINYEKEITGNETHLNKALGLASSDESDDVDCIVHINANLRSYTYTHVEYWDENESASQVEQKINAGLGFISHSGHANTKKWGSVDFSVDNANNLTNTLGMLPFNYTVGCGPGNFPKAECLGESLLKSEHNGQPTGLVADHMSIVSQPWDEPYTALREQVNILTEQFSVDNWSFGGIAINGTAKMIDHFEDLGPWVAETWAIFGDPSLLVFTDNPTAMTVSHNQQIDLGATSFTVNCNVENALISLTANGEIIGTAYSNGRLTNIIIDPALSTADETLEVTITARNKVPYFGSVLVGSVTEPPVSNFTASETTVEVNNPVTFTDNSTNLPISWNWTFEGGTPATSTEENPVVTYNQIGTYNISLIVTNQFGSNELIKTDYIDIVEQFITYCSSQGNDPSYEWIKTFNLGVFTKSNSGSASYSDYTSDTISMEAGATVQLNLTPGYKNTVYNELWEIWIDYNRNGDFNDASEEVFSGSGENLISGSFTVNGAATGTTRMRISMKRGSYPTSCEAFTYGEVEDYTVDLGSVHVSIEDLTKEEINVYPNPTQEYFYISSKSIIGAEMYLIDMMGRVVISQKIVDNTTKINTTNLNKGIYMLQIISDNNTISKKIIIS